MPPADRQARQPSIAESPVLHNLMKSVVPRTRADIKVYIVSSETLRLFWNRQEQRRGTLRRY